MPEKTRPGSPVRSSSPLPPSNPSTVVSGTLPFAPVKSTDLILLAPRSDIVGRKLVLLFGLLIFLIASLACALAQSMIQLIVFRAWQGVGGGSILTLVLVIMGDVVRDLSFFAPVGWERSY